jgi:hypothetical protein
VSVDSNKFQSVFEANFSDKSALKNDIFFVDRAPIAIDGGSFGAEDDHV